MIAAPRRRRLSADDWRNLRTALPFIAPWIVGFLAFTLYPIIYSLYLSFTNYSGFGDATPAGLENYKHMASDSLFWQSLGNTLYYTALAVPVGVVVAIALALMMNQNVREVAIYRAAFYVPSILPLFALTFIFIVLLNPAFVLAGGTSGGGAYTTGPENSLLFYVFYLYKSAFQYSDMGYAAAMAWVLFVISVVLSFAILRWSRQWVHYEGA